MSAMSHTFHDCPVVSGGITIHREDCPSVPPHSHAEAEAARQVTELRAALKHTLTHAQLRDCFLCVQSAALLAGDKAETPTYPADWRDMTPEQWDETAARARTEP